ncbi:prenyltransferase/squalene oxidase repeat-containing protein [Schlesneria paludicola]|uniref:prenyltransferase/squalene oxidase repeat-containing protein n=1 Tax=Schlesneria paludicola TaxID=360056 RepID=UPI00029A24E2|nr:prenyltransferase/squalene oxidase repeat-containing protein [Schlesneria paludicola]
MSPVWHRLTVGDGAGSGLVAPHSDHLSEFAVSESETMKFTRRLMCRTTLPSVIWFLKSWLQKPFAEGKSTAYASASEVPSDATSAIIRGLEWLAANQMQDGGFGGPHSYARNVGVCALSGMAFLAHGGTRGKFGSNVKQCTDYLLAMAHSSGFIVEAEIKTHAPLYGHGFATMYLGQVCGMDRRREVRDALKRATSFILSVQTDKGAWCYTDSPDDADVSITTCQMMALISARQAGIFVPRHVIQRSVDFLLRCQNADGGFRYRLIDPPESLFPRSAAAVVALCAAGLHNHPALANGRAYLASPTSTPPPDKAEYYYYGRFYAVHAAWQEGAAAWNRWFPATRVELLERQSNDGRWRDTNIGDEYATAMALNILQFPCETIPLFQC